MQFVFGLTLFEVPLLNIIQKLTKLYFILYCQFVSYYNVKKTEGKILPTGLVQTIMIKKNPLLFPCAQVIGL